MRKNKTCFICTAGDYPSDPPVRQYTWGDHSFYVCDDCATKKICPQCWGRGEIAVKKPGKPFGILVCDLCRGSGYVEYNERSDPEEYKMIKVPAWVYNNLKQTRIAMERHRLNPKKDLTALKNCPACNTEMKNFKLKYEYDVCEKCGYTQQRIDLSATGHIALGIIIGLGAAALWKYLSKNTERK